MQYMLLLYGNQTAWDALIEADVDHLAVAAGELEVDGVLVVNANGAAITVTDGPFSEGQQVISGYYIVACVDTARATQLAGKFAELKFAPIEVRRLGKGSTWTELQRQR